MSLLITKVATALPRANPKSRGDHAERLADHIRQRREKAKSIGGKGLFLGRLESSPELKSLNRQLETTPRLRSDLSALCRQDDLTQAYLKRRASDIARYGHEYADLLSGDTTN